MSYNLPVTPYVRTITDSVRMLIYGTTTNTEGVGSEPGPLIDIPTDIISGDFTDVINGGSGTATFTVPRAFVDTGLVQYGNRVQLYLWDSVDPWFDGRILNFNPNQIQSLDYEQITVYAEGWQTQLNFAITSDAVNTGMTSQGAIITTTVNADAFLNLELNGGQLDGASGGGYVDSSNFQTPVAIPSIPIILDAIQFNGTGLSDAINQIVSQIHDEEGNIYEWWVRGQVGKLPYICIQPQPFQKPPTGSIVNSGLLTKTSPSQTPATPYFLYVWKDSDIRNFQITFSSQNLYNNIALYGGTDPLTQQTVYGYFKDSVSISLYGLRQQKVTDSSIISAAALNNYATVYLLTNGYPQPQGSFEVLQPSDSWRAGQWCQVGVNVPQQLGESGLEPQILQFRVVKVETSWTNQGDKLVQIVSVSAPRPMLDEVYFASVNTANNAASLSALQPQASMKDYFVASGLDWLGLATSS